MLPLSKIAPIAQELMDRLKPHCEIIRVAGGIRRQKMECHDIELVLIPKKKVITRGDLFSPKADTTIVVDKGFAQEAKSLGRIVKGRVESRMMQIELPKNIMLDMFMPDPPDFYRQFVIRTGSRDYVVSTITKAWLRKGWCGCDNEGLRRQDDCERYQDASGKWKWRLSNPEPLMPPVWQSEEDFYNWLGIPIIHPKLRTI